MIYTIQIQETTNYGKFKTIRGNREINKVHLKKLEEAISNNNLLSANPIIVNDRYQILDGQHRLLVCEKLGIPVYYVVVKSGSLPEIQMLNTNVRNWGMEDFLRSYIERGNEEYMKLQGFVENTGLSLATSIFLMNGGVHKSTKHNDYVSAFKSGDFKAKFIDYAQLMAKRINELAKYCDDNANMDRDFVSALARVYRAGITHQELVHKLEKSRIRIPRLGTGRQYIRLLEDILSWKNKAPVRLI